MWPCLRSIALQSTQNSHRVQIRRTTALWWQNVLAQSKSYSLNALNMIEELWPPKPNEFDRAMLMSSFCFAWPTITSISTSSSGSVILMLGCTSPATSTTESFSRSAMQALTGPLAKKVTHWDLVCKSKMTKGLQAYCRMLGRGAKWQSMHMSRLGKPKKVQDKYSVHVYLSCTRAVQVSMAYPGAH